MDTRNQRRVTHLPPGEGPAVWATGDTYTFKALSEDTDGTFALCEGSIPPQSGPPPHIHLREEEAYYVLEGELEVLDGDRTFTASAGSFIHIPKGALHRFKNVGEKTARMLIIFAPGGFDGFFFEVGQPARKGEPAPPFGEEELERALRAAPKYGLEVPPPPEQ